MVARRLNWTKNKTTVEVADVAELINTLNVIKAAVLAGELDAQIEAASGQLRSGFKR